MTAVGDAYVPIRPDFRKFSKDATGPAKAAGKRIAKMIGAAIIASKAVSEIKKSINLVKSLAKETVALSRVTGLDNKEASRWIATAKARGIEGAKLQVSFTALSKKMLAARDGSKESRKEFRALGVDMDTLKRGNFQEVLGKIADAFKKMPDGPKKTAIASKLFGRSYATLLPLLNDGKVAMEDALAVSDKYGNTLSKKQVKAALAAAKAQREFSMATDGLRIKLGTALLPIITAATTAATGLVQQLQTGEGPLGHIAGVIGHVAGTLASILVPVLKIVSHTISSLPDVVQIAIGSLATMVEVLGATGPWGAALVGIAGAAVLIKDNWKTVGPVFEKVKDKVAPIGKSIADAVMPTLEQIPGKAQSAFGSISQWASGAFADVKQWVSGAIENITKWLDLGGGKAGDFGQAISNIFNVVKGIAINTGKVFGWVFQSVILPVVKRVLPGVQQYVEGVVTAIGGIVKIFTGIFTGDWSKALEGVKQLLRGQFKAVLGVIRATTAPLRALGALIFRGFVGAIKGSVKLVVGAAKAIGGAVWDGVKGLPGKLYDLGKSVVSRFGKGLSGLGSALGRALKSGFNFFGNLGRGIADWINDHTPLGDAITLNLGVKKIHFRLPALAKGGIVPGASGQILAEVNERGWESITDPRTGYTTMLGDGSRQVMALPVGWRVNTAGQTRRMMPGYADGGITRYKKGLGAAVGIDHKNYAYAFGGGHNGSFAPSYDIRGNGRFGYDCSGYVSAILHAAGLLGSPISTDGVKTMPRGAGKIVTVAVRGTTGAKAHTMIKWGKRFFESGSGHGPMEVGGWSGGGWTFHHPAGENLLKIPGGGGGAGGGRAKRIAAKLKEKRKANREARKQLPAARWDLAIAEAESTPDPADDIAAYRGRREYFKGLLRAVRKQLAKKGLSASKKLALTQKATEYVNQIKSDNDMVYQLLHPEDTSSAATSAVTDNPALATLLSNSLADARMLRAQLPIFQRFGGLMQNATLPYAGKFHDGGIVPGRPGQESVAVVKAGEGIFTEDQMRGAPIVFQVIVEDEAVDAEKIRILAVEAQREENRKAGRRTAGPTVGRRTG